METAWITMFSTCFVFKLRLMVFLTETFNRYYYLVTKRHNCQSYRYMWWWWWWCHSGHLSSSIYEIIGITWHIWLQTLKWKKGKVCMMQLIKHGISELLKLTLKDHHITEESSFPSTFRNTQFWLGFIYWSALSDSTTSLKVTEYFISNHTLTWTQSHRQY